MDPTMGETNGLTTALTTEPGASAYLGGAAELQAETTETTDNAVPATNYPVGAVDFNKPFDVFNTYDHDEAHTNPRVLTVLTGNSYPVVVVSTDSNGDEVVHQFDTDGDALDVDLKIENTVAEEVTKFILVERSGRRSFDTSIYDTEDEARNDADSDIFHAIIPFVIPIEAQLLYTTAPSSSLVIDGDDNDGDVEDEENHDGDLEDTASGVVASDPEGSVRVNGSVYVAGDKVAAYRQGFGQRTCTVLKTRSTDIDPYKSLYIQANDGSVPYWALNKNIRWKVTV
jgi:hypothetical protein